MSLRDEHLQQALRHAPDQALAPSRKVRENVLGYAASAVKPKPANWLKRCLNTFDAWRVASWQVAGMGAIASVLLVLVMVREQLPDESIWVKSEVKDVARNRVEAPAANAPEQDKLEAPARSEGPQAKAKRSSPAEGAPTKKLAETNTSVSASAAPELADKANDAVAADKVPETVVTAPAPEVKQVLSKTAPASAPAVSGMATYEVPIAHTLITALIKALIKEGGEAVAKKDIEAGNLRILKIEALECGKTGKHESSFDALTNYKVVVLEVCRSEGEASNDKASSALLQREVGAYNQTMLNWYQTHKN